MSSAYHPESDGSTERANRTVTTMVRMCVDDKQNNWVLKLPAIEFAINSATSDSTGYAPFFLNSGRIPQSMIWHKDEAYPGVRKFAQTMKDAVLSAHDAILFARIKQTRLANRKRKSVPFVNGDLVYLSTKNISIPKGRARKLAPKFIGPYRIIEDFGNASFRLDLPAELKQRGLHPSFHAKLLRIHIPNDDRRFPGRQINQIVSLGNSKEWAVSKISAHKGSGTDAVFSLVWKTGDTSWLPLHEVSHLTAYKQYLEAIGVSSASALPAKLEPVNQVSEIPLL